MPIKRFTWIADSTYTRRFGRQDPRFLEKGKTYDAGGIPQSVLATWEKTGHIKIAGEPKKSETKAGKED